VPVGRLADRVGRGRVFVAGYALLAGVYLVLLSPGSGLAGVVLAVAMLGAFYAATEGVLMAMASAVLPESLRTSGLSVLTTFTSLGRLCASILFGALWTVFGQSSALVVVFVGLLGALALAVPLVVRRQEVEAHA
jgi:MFS family permease